MVLQQGKDINVYGTAAAGEKVEVAFQGKTASIEADKDGNWKVNIGQFKAGGSYEMTIKGSNTVAIKDILVGEVWICSGQSNAAWGTGGCTNGPAEVAAANFPQIRMFNCPWTPATKPQPSILWGAWRVCEPGAPNDWSAVGYFFARELHKKIKVPIGVINSSLGATPSEAWTSAEGMSDPAIVHYKKKHEENCRNLQKELDTYFQQIDEWKKQATAAAAAGAYIPNIPGLPRQLSDCHEPVLLYNGMIHPLTGYKIRGAIWYQGESNAGRAVEYRTLFPALIKDWRRAWNDDISFLWIQLSTVAYASAREPYESDWALLREAQTMTLKLPKTGQAVTFDVGDGDIHPRNKQDMGYRLALIATAQYGQDVVFSGPMYRPDSMKIEGGKIRLSFINLGGGLTSQPGATLIPRAEAPKDTPLADSELKRFEIAGEDKKFVWANAKIDGATVVVWSDKVPKPVAVRYAWAENPTGANFFNKAGLPACPFRTDDWEYKAPPGPPSYAGN
jgi:sialate O-acetylesterase